MVTRSDEIDELTKAVVTVAWVIALNKPFYPLYVWYLVDEGAITSVATLIAAPFFLLIPYLACRSPLAARLALPCVGTLDTLFETKLFGHASGTELFLAACIMLVALSFRPEEKWWQRGMAVFVFSSFLFSRYVLGPPFYPWSEADTKALLDLNLFAVACLLTFIALRWAGVARSKRPERQEDG